MPETVPWALTRAGLLTQGVEVVVGCPCVRDAAGALWAKAEKGMSGNIRKQMLPFT